MDKGRIWIIGWAPEDRETKLRKVFSQADEIIAAEHLRGQLHRWEALPEHKVFYYRRFSEALAALEKAVSSGKKVAFLASGDPLFFGVGRTLLERFGKERVEIISAVSSLQLAFSRLKIPWEDALFVSLHGRGKTARAFGLEDLPALVRRHPKIAVLTDPEIGPPEIAEVLWQNGLSQDLCLYVCERLGYEDEKIFKGTPEEIRQKRFRDPNLVILIRESLEEFPVLGLREREIRHEQGLLTKDEVRAVVLHKLRLPEKGVFWDVGAGSGAVACEAARLSPGVSVLAVEREPQRVKIIEENRKKFGLANLKVIQGEAPEVLSHLPAPDRVFIGGGGRRLPEILAEVWAKVKKGPVVVSAITLETVTEVFHLMKKAEILREVVCVQVSRSKDLSDYIYLRAENPVYLFVGEKNQSFQTR